MKKLFFLFTAALVAMAANAKVTTISPDPENDALRLAVHYAEDGDTIEMTEGTYVQCNNNYVAFDGKSITVKAAEGANVVLQLQVPITLTNGGKATLQGIKIDASRLTELANYGHVIYATDATEGKELVMEDCEFYGFDFNKSAIYAGSDKKLDLCKINNCYFHNNDKSCLFFEGESLGELVVTNSTFANITAKVTDSYYAGPIDVRNTNAKVTVDHCTFYNCFQMSTDYSTIYLKSHQAANVVISNNIFMFSELTDGQRAIRESVEATNCMTFNYKKDNGGLHSDVTKTNCFLNVNPKFVDAANGNFALAEDSPALTAGTDGKAIGDPRWNAPAVEEPEGVTYELDGGELPTATVPTQEELWASFKTAAGLTTLGTLVEITEAGAGKPHNAPDNPCACRIICAKLLDVNVNAVFALPEWAWLKAYIMTVQSGLPEVSNVSWRYAFAAFFLQSEHSAYPASADFTEAGKPENWGPAYQAAHAVVLPTEPVDAPYTLPTPVKEGYTFVGWYDNAEGTGEAYTVIPAGWSGTLYAIWEVQGPATALDNIAVEGKAVKTIINGQLIIIKNGVQYNALGQVIK